MKKTMLMVALSLASSTAQDVKTDLPLLLPFRLTGEGHACSGYLHVTPKRLVWRSSFSVCASSGWTVRHEGDSWVFDLPPGPESKACRMRTMRMHPLTAVSKDSLWELTGFLSLDELKEHPKSPVLDCVMQ